MFNTTNTTNKTTVNVPATGMIQRSNVKSFFLRMHSNSALANELLAMNPVYKNKKVAVIQVLLMDKEWILVEIVEESEL